MPNLNLGIVAHVDAGKTSLTERLLFDAGAVAELGSVDAGTTRTDSMDLERRRGITIRAAVTGVRLDGPAGLDVNLLDTPGHPDFIAEVERSLTVLDAAVLVVSAVEGVQPQTVVLWRALARLQIPTVVFVNKLDRPGAAPDRVAEQLRRRLAAPLVVLATAVDAGTRAVRVRPVPLNSDGVVQALADVDDDVLAAAVAGRTPSAGVLRRTLRAATAARALTPLVCGSAVTGAGTDELRQLLVHLLPRTDGCDGPVAASVFAVDRDERGRRAWLRIWRGELRVRVRYGPAGRRPERVTDLALTRAGALVDASAAGAGAVVAVRGPQSWRVGDVLGEPPARRRHRFAPATLQAGVEPCDPGQREALFAALRELADEDPLIDVRRDEDGCALSLHGEVQQQVIAALLEERFGVRARFRGLRTVCIERVTGPGSALDEIGIGDNPYLATIGLRVEPGRAGSGIAFSPGVERGHLPPAFVAATEEGVRAALQQGRRGWTVTDCRVTLTRSHYQPRQSHTHQKFSKAMSSVGADFRHLAQVVVVAALEQAGTVVCEPVDRYELEFPEALVNPVSALLGRLGANVLDSRTAAGWARFTGDLRSAVVPELAARLPDLSGGEAVLQTGFDHYAPVPGRPPRRLHTGPDPRRRGEWFRAMPR
jgi:ribosomal protection tetracycline resistance protein